MRFRIHCLVLLLALAATSACRSAKKAENQGSSAGKAAVTNAAPGTYLTAANMAKDDGNGNPGEQTDHFGSGDRTIHCVAELKEAKAGTPLKFAWWVVEAEGAKNEKIKEFDYATKPGEGVVHGHVTLPQAWPPGTYKVEVYVNGNLDRVVQYTVD